MHDARTLGKRTVAEFFDDHCTQLAASMSYYILFSIFPLAILLVSIAGLILTDDALRGRVVDALLEALPVSSGAAREDLESLIDPIAHGRSAVGLISILGLLWGASGMMGALRYSLNTAWDHEYRRPFVRGKLVDFGLVLGVGGLLTLSIAATMLLQVARNVSGDVADALGPFGPGAGGLVTVIALLAPFLLTTTTFVLVFTVVPSLRVRKRDALAGALLSGVLFELLKHSFAWYLRKLLELRRGLRFAGRDDRAAVLHLPERVRAAARGGTRGRVAAGAARALRRQARCGHRRSYGALVSARAAGRDGTGGGRTATRRRRRQTWRRARRGRAAVRRSGASG